MTEFIALCLAYIEFIALYIAYIEFIALFNLSLRGNGGRETGYLDQPTRLDGRACDESPRLSTRAHTG